MAMDHRRGEHKKWATRIAAILCAVVATSSSFAANKCIDAKGKVTYQDIACEGPIAAQKPVDTSDAFNTKPSRPASVPPVDSRSGSVDKAYANAHGAWRGPAQFQVTVGGVRDGAVQTVTPMVIELKQSGEVVGVIPAPGCTISGLATQFVAEYMASIDISLKGCRDDRFNTRFTGYLTATKASKEAKLNLNGLTMKLPTRQLQQTSLEAVLKR
jgi:hypothetical protein